MAEICEHLERAAHGRSEPARPSTHGCEDCLKAGSRWVHLRLCLACGHVGCCDSSQLRHATRHFHATSHPVIKSFEPGEDWAWCYVDSAYLEELPAFSVESPQVHYTAPAL